MKLHNSSRIFDNKSLSITDSLEMVSFIHSSLTSIGKNRKVKTLELIGGWKWHFNFREEKLRLSVLLVLAWVCINSKAFKMRIKVSYTSLFQIRVWFTASVQLLYVKFYLARLFICLNLFFFILKWCHFLNFRSKMNHCLLVGSFLTNN